jgi:hypothetical protein
MLAPADAENTVSTEISVVPVKGGRTTAAKVTWALKLPQRSPILGETPGKLCGSPTTSHAPRLFPGALRDPPVSRKLPLDAPASTWSPG